MKLPPTFIRFKMRHAGFGIPTLWFPIVLLWPILFVALFILFFAGLILVVVLDTRSVSRFMTLFSGLYDTVCLTRGIRVDVEGKDSQILLSID